MSRRSLSILIVLLAVIAIGVVWLVGGVGGSTKDVEELAAPTREASDSRASPAPELADAPSEAASRALPVEPEPSVPHRTGAAAPDFDPELANAAWIDGRVIIPRGTPSDEHVVIVAEGMPFESRDFHRVVVGPDGSFRVAFARETRMGVLRLEGRYLYLKDYHSLNLPLKTAEIVLRPRLGGCIRGRVLLPPSGNASPTSIVGCRVSASTGSGNSDSLPSETAAPATTILDETLQFELGGVPSRATCHLTLRAGDSWHADPVEVKVSPGRISTADILVEATGRISGLVVDSDGRPVSRSSVRVRRAGQPPGTAKSHRTSAEGRTDPEGRYELTGLVAGAYQVWAEAKDAVDSVPTDFDLVPGEEVPNLDLRLSRGGRIVGQVIDANDRPAPGGRVQASSTGWRRSKSTSVDGQGQFEIGGLVPGEYELKTERQAQRTTVISSRLKVVQVEDGQTTQVVLGGKNEEAVIVQGTVRSGGRPAAGWQVTAISFGKMESGPRSTTCDANGAYRLVLDHGGWFNFQLESAGPGAGLSESVEVPSAKSFEKDFDLAGKGRISGRVVDGKGAAAGSVVVTVWPDAEPDDLGGRAFFGDDTTDALGAFAFEGLPAGHYRLEASERSGSGEPTASKRGSPVSTALDEDESVEGLVLTIQEACSVEVSLRRADGKSVPFASVEAVGQRSYGDSFSLSSSAHASSRYELHGLLPGEVIVNASTNDPPLAGTSTVVLAPGETGKVEIVLHPATVLVVRVDSPGRDPRDVLVGVRDQRGAAVDFRFDLAALAPNGSNASERSFGPVSAGHYTVFAGHPDGASARSEIEITGEPQHIVLLSLKP